MSAAIPVLLYHSVSDRPTWGAVSTARFVSDVDAMVVSRRPAVSITTLARGLRNPRPFTDYPMAVTFDDGYDDTYAAVELLCAHGLCSTVYVTTAEIGRPGRLSPRQLRVLADTPGVEIGSHGVHHRRLDELGMDEILAEVRDSKQHLEDLLGEPVTSFAYPYGAYDTRVRSVLIGAGYHSAAAVKNALSHPADDPFAIARWTVTASASRSAVADIVAGRGAPLASNRERWRTRAYRTARRQRQRTLGWGTPKC